MTVIFPAAMVLLSYGVLVLGIGLGFNLPAIFEVGIGSVCLGGLLFAVSAIPRRPTHHGYFTRSRPKHWWSR